MSAKQFMDIAIALEKRIKSGPADPLPSIALLADEFSVSYLTMWRALRVLADKGVITMRKGARTLTASGARPKGARDRFLDTMRSNIQDGTWKSGEHIPKFSYFQSEYHVGQDTISRAMQRLAREGLLHKRGRKWIVGPSSSARPGLVHTRAGGPSPRVALMLFPWLMDANNFFTPSHLEPFVSSFTDELIRRGISIQVVVQKRKELEPENTVAGLNDIASLIDSLGGRYCGMIAHDVGFSAEETASFLHAMLAQKKPVVYFDSIGNQPGFNRSRFGPKKPFYRLFFNEEQAVALALNHLYCQGHRVIGFPDIPRYPYPWVARRIQLARSAASRYDRPPRLIAPMQTEPFWTFNQSEALNVLNPLFDGISRVLHLDKQLTHGIQAKSSIKRKLLSETPSMAQIIDAGATAIIAGNDFFARDYYYWFRIMGIDIPQRISMISFDNQREFFTFPMSTIDYGFARLGYLAAHILIGDIPAKADGEGQIPGVCTLVDRGSTAVPRRGNIG